MITLRPLQPDEFAAFAAYFVPDYAAEIVANYRASPADAWAQATKELAIDFPQGADTPGESLMCIILADHVVGYLFYRINSDTQTAFINDFHILPPYRSQGHGTAALAAMAAQLKPQGITQIRLRVAATNAAAQRLYAKLGFFPTGINMAKTL
jgi:ribosomal protein S18 acetylase RimI-like enzyme